MENHGAGWTVVAKVVCGHQETLLAFQYMGVHSMGDSRRPIHNLKKMMV